MKIFASTLFVTLLLFVLPFRQSFRSGASAPSFCESDTTGLIHIWYGPVQHFGRLGEPQRWINVLGRIAGPDQVVEAVYSINGEAEQPLTLGSDRHRLAEPGDFNVELGWDEVEEGENTLVVEKGNTWPLPYRIDFTKVKDLQDVVQIVDGHWRLTEDGVRTVVPYYDRVLTMGDTSWANYETTVRLTVHGFTPPEPGPPTYDVTHFGVAMRWRGHHADDRQPSRRWYPMGSQGEFLLKNDLDSCRWRILFGGESRAKPIKYAEGRKPLKLGQPIRIKTQAATMPDGRTRYRFKQWAEGEPEPLEWDVEGYESGDYPSGALCLVPHNSEVTIHEVWVEPI